MNTFFMICALVGGTLLICQFLMTLIGFGGGHSDFEVASDLDVEMGHECAGDAHFDADHDFVAAHDFDGDGHAEATEHPGSNWLFGIISFRTLVAASTFFGISGLTMDAAGQPPLVQVLVAVVIGGIAMYVVHWVMSLFKQLSYDGTVRLDGAIGKIGTVHVSVPGAREGGGKVRISHQERLLYVAAVTDHPSGIKTGAKVKITGVVKGGALQVEPVLEAAAKPAKPV